MKRLKLIVYVLSAAVIVLFLFIMLVHGAEKIQKYHLIGIGSKEVALKAVEDPVLIDTIPGRGVDEITFEGKTYKMFCQFSRNYKGYNGYLASHGCAVTSLTTILRAYVPECSDWTPYETITIAEKTVAGASAFKTNYSRRHMPISLYGITQVFDHYGIDYEYEPSFSSDAAVKKDIIDHLHEGKPVMFIVSQKNRATGTRTSKWTGSYHTMIMIGVDKNNNVLIGNPAGSQRFQLVSLDEMINFMWSSTEDPISFYWYGINRCGGYIKIME